MAFFYGPLNKTIYTQEFELFAKCLLVMPNAIKFAYQEQAGQKQLYGYLGQENLVSVNISALLTKADYTHIHLSESDSKAYFNYYKNSEYKHYDYSNDSDSDMYHHGSFCPVLTQSETITIKDYTGSYYVPINRLMYKNGLHYENIESVIEQKEVALDILKTLFISSGLNKIMPDTNSEQVYSFRGEHSTTEAQIQERIESIKLPDSFVQTPAYMSTSSDPGVAEEFSGNVMIKFEGLYGKHIECISEIPYEKEYLLQPAKIQWTGHEEKTIPLRWEPNATKITHEFSAKVVNPLIQSEQEPSIQEVAEFKKIVEWAKFNNIDTDFITEHTKNLYLFKEEVSEWPSTVSPYFTPLNPIDPLLQIQPLKGEWAEFVIL